METAEKPEVILTRGQVIRLNKDISCRTYTETTALIGRASTIPVGVTLEYLGNSFPQNRQNSQTNLPTGHYFTIPGQSENLKMIIYVTPESISPSDFKVYGRLSTVVLKFFLSRIVGRHKSPNKQR